MCKQFEDGLNEDIKLLVGILEVKEFVFLVNRAHKIDDLSKEKEKLILKSEIQEKGSKTQVTSVASVGSVKDNKCDSQRCGRRDFGECRAKDGACFKCGSLKHFSRDCPKIFDKEKVQNIRSSNNTMRGRPPRNPKNVICSCGVTKHSAVRSEARAPARASAIRALEEAFAPDVITGTFSIIDPDVIALIDPR
ncbi:uncharacterized protein LOC105793167 [Gossypium raimondii]|uniref:uncharacterized protein LOC105793167 n=1 Tax=Gossypium raimondii TaxID=29730 RepID=UPI00063AF98C|nr:uncharacterized protein LOC105793167 [Gossypium raimondii]